MRYLGLEIEEDHHPWSENKWSFTSRELLDNLVDKVFPHEKTIICLLKRQLQIQHYPPSKMWEHYHGWNQIRSI